MRHLRRFKELFGKIAVATAATSCTGGVDNSEFATNVCSGATLSPLDGVTPGTPVEHMELRVGNVVRFQRGVPCDPGTPCGVQLASTTSTVGWKAQTLDAPAEPRYLVYTRGNTVGTVTSIDELKKFLAPIENPHDAALLVTEAFSHSMLCRGNNARQVPGGWEIATQSGYACGAGTELDENIVFVATNGDISIRDVYVIERGSDNCAIGRRPEGLGPATNCVARDPIGEYFARAARLEAASVHAFSRLADELVEFGAPARLVREARRSREDEIRHARVTRALARRHGARVQPVRVRRHAQRSLFAMLRENAAEGQVRETFGALVATHQGLHATDRLVARTMRRIAVDETRHAALAWDVARWGEARLTSTQREELAASRAHAVDELADSIRFTRPIAEAGVPGPAISRQLLDQFRRRVLDVMSTATK